jgi:hypothetical protein
MDPQTPSRRTHTRRPPLAEIDTYELWQAWKQGERRRVWPWLALLVGFCVVLAAMYSFFYVSSVLSGDMVFPILLAFGYLGFLYWIFRRISPRRDFALALVALMVAVSVVAFALWLLIYAFSGWSVWVGIFGTAILGIAGLIIALPGLNVMARGQASEEK